MTKSAFGFMTASLLILSACARPQPSGEVVTYYPKPLDEYGVYIQHKEYTIFDIGRTISNNSVDIYDPALTTLQLPADDPKFISPLVAFPADPYMLIKDDDVVVYSLYSKDMPDTEEYTRVIDDVPAPPVPLVEDGSQLPP